MNTRKKIAKEVSKFADEELIDARKHEKNIANKVSKSADEEWFKQQEEYSDARLKKMSEYDIKDWGLLSLIYNF
jgi:hypothetical protein